MFNESYLIFAYSKKNTDMNNKVYSSFKKRAGTEIIVPFSLSTTRELKGSVTEENHWLRED